MNMKKPRVSIGMPVYNAAAYLREAIESILAQSFTDFELMISDNASTDETESICREFLSRDRRVRYDRLEANQGAIANYNRLVELSEGEYFKWAAGDDVCAPLFLEKLVDVLDCRPEVLWCHSASGKIDDTGRVLTIDDPAAENLAHTRQAGLPRRDHDSPVRHRRYRGVLMGTTWCADVYGLFRRSLLEQTGLIAPCYGSEKALIGEFALRGLYYEVPETLFFQRVHANTAGHLQTAAQQTEYVTARPGRRFTFTRFMLLREHLRCVNRVPMSYWDRARCYAVIGEYLLQYQKWFGVLRTTLLGKAIGHERSRPVRVAKNKGEVLLGSTESPK